MNFKGVQTLWETSVEFTKILSQHVFTKVNLVGHTCMQKKLDF
jgi:hypothetical protein